MTTWLVILLLVVMSVPGLADAVQQQAAARWPCALEVRRAVSWPGHAARRARIRLALAGERSPPTSLRGSSTARADAGREAWCYWQNTPGQWLNQWREPWAADDELLDALRRPPGDVAWKVEATAQFLCRTHW